MKNKVKNPKLDAHRNVGDFCSYLCVYSWALQVPSSSDEPDAKDMLFGCRYSYAYDPVSFAAAAAPKPGGGSSRPEAGGSGSAENAMCFMFPAKPAVGAVSGGGKLAKYSFTGEIS